MKKSGTINSQIGSSDTQNQESSTLKKAEDGNHQASGFLFIVSAPSGAGKNTLVEKLLATHASIYKESNSLKRVVTYTSKKPRLGDVDGKDYHFISEADFEKKIQEGFFLEYSTAYGNYYGTPRFILTELSQGASFFIIIDQYGAQAISKLYQKHVLIWIEPSSIEELESRLIKRAGESAEDIAKRLELARVEMAQQKENPSYHYYITNSNVEQGVKHLQEIVFKYFKKN